MHRPGKTTVNQRTDKIGHPLNRKFALEVQDVIAGYIFGVYLLPLILDNRTRGYVRECEGFRLP